MFAMIKCAKNQIGSIYNNKAPHRAHIGYIDNSLCVLFCFAPFAFAVAFAVAFPLLFAFALCLCLSPFACCAFASSSARSPRLRFSPRHYRWRDRVMRPVAVVPGAAPFLVEPCAVLLRSEQRVVRHVNARQK